MRDQRAATLPDFRAWMEAWIDMAHIAREEMIVCAFAAHGEGPHDWTLTIDPDTGRSAVTDTASGEVLATSWLRVPAELLGEASR